MKYEIAKVWMILVALAVLGGFGFVFYNMGKVGFLLLGILAFAIMTAWAIKTIVGHDYQ